MNKLALYGAGDLGSEIYELCNQCEMVGHNYDEVFFVDDNPLAKAYKNVRLIDFDGLKEECGIHDVHVAICIGEPRARRDVSQKLKHARIGLATLVHPEVEIPTSVQLGSGCIVYRGSYIGPNTSIGSNTLIIRSFIAHHCVVGNDCVLDANTAFAGHVTIGDQSFMSIGSTVKEGVSIGSRVIVGVGAAVFLDVEDDLYIVGNPARPMRRNEDQRVFRG